MKKIPLGFVRIICFIYIFSVFSRVHAAEIDIFSTIDTGDPSNAVQAIGGNVTASEFLRQLFHLSFSKNKEKQKFGGLNIADIVAGSLSYAKEFHVGQEDWNKIVDAFLLEGYLVSDDEKYKNGYAVLIWQRSTKLAQLARKELMISNPVKDF